MSKSETTTKTETVTFEQLVARVEQLEQSFLNQKRGGPKSENGMTDEIAYDIKFGSNSKLSHKDTAIKLGLSYGQVYSCRCGYTYTHVTKDFKKQS